MKLYGYTDSLFLYNIYESSKEIISKFIEECNKQLGVEVEHSKTYKTAIIFDKKKHYIGWTCIDGKEPHIVGMEGEKSDRPTWINNVFEQFVKDIINDINPCESKKIYCRFRSKKSWR